MTTEPPSECCPEPKVVEAWYDCGKNESVQHLILCQYHWSFSIMKKNIIKFEEIEK